MKRLTKRQLCAVAHSIAHGTVIARRDPVQPRAGEFRLSDCEAAAKMGLLERHWSGISTVAFGDTPAGRAHITAACVVEEQGWVRSSLLEQEQEYVTAYRAARDDALAELARLKEDNARLREALEPFDKWSDVHAALEGDEKR